MFKLTDKCWTIQGGKIVEGTLMDFTRFIETTTRPDGIDYKYYVVARERKGKDAWFLAKWEGKEVLVYEYDSEQEAEEAAEACHASDILGNGEFAIHLSLESAEAEFASIFGRRVLSVITQTRSLFPFPRWGD